MLKLSIIIPVFNAELYLKRCLQSVVSQDIDMREYEVIVVNDGSTDNSKKIVLDFQKQFSNIIYLEQKNRGVSVARNNGLDTAIGEYVLFVDADDELHENVLNSIMKLTAKEDLDLLYLKIEYFNDNDEYIGYFKMDKEEVEILDGFHHQRMGYVFGIYKNKLIKKIRFIPDIPIGEDALFNVIVHAKARRCSYYNKASYKYYKRQGSATNSILKYSDAAFIGFIKIIGELKTLVEDNKERWSNDQIKYFDRPFYKTIEMTLRSSVIPKLSIAKYKTLKQVIVANQLEYLTPRISENVKYFDRHWILFFSYYTIEKGYYIILENLSKLKRKLIKND